ncbi:MAG: quinone oxidoreductase [Acidobacteria bacterium RIFCSPLOWO2_02_FULL_65_29]|nr:MAG: quinone oxidoreductase [Acidobacteria bacterium RIFCSPLOWO2_02_FULL_65_29]
MRAIIVREFGKPDVMKLENVPTPAPGPSEVLVRIRAAGVNPVEAYIRAATYARKPNLPYTPGTDAAGEVESAGAGVTDFKHGDRVYISGDNLSASGAGTYAEYAVCTRAMLHRLPPKVSFAQGAAMGVPYATAYRALFHRAAAKAGETVLVHGATGGVGIAAIQIARAHGLTAIGTGGTDRGIAVVKEQGATAVFNHKEPNYLDQVMQATDGRGVDVVLEMAAHINLDKDLSILAPRGRVVVIGNRGRIEIDARQAMARDAAILGMTLFNVTPPELVSIHAALVAGLANGSLNPVVGREMSLGDAARAHEAVLEPGALGKIVLVI